MEVLRESFDDFYLTNKIQNNSNFEGVINVSNMNFFVEAEHLDLTMSIDLKLYP